jgi:hypothetical protein
MRGCSANDDDLGKVGGVSPGDGDGMGARLSIEGIAVRKVGPIELPPDGTRSADLGTDGKVNPKDDDDWEGN